MPRGVLWRPLDPPGGSSRRLSPADRGHERRAPLRDCRVYSRRSLRGIRTSRLSLLRPSGQQGRPRRVPVDRRVGRIAPKNGQSCSISAGPFGLGRPAKERRFHCLLQSPSIRQVGAINVSMPALGRCAWFGGAFSGRTCLRFLNGNQYLLPCPSRDVEMRCVGCLAHPLAVSGS